MYQFLFLVGGGGGGGFQQ